MIAELEEDLKKTGTAIEIEYEASLMAQGLDDFVKVIDDGTSSEEFVEAKKGYGDKTEAAGRSLGFISSVLMLLIAVATAYGYVLYLRGGISGDPKAEMVFVRIGVALFAGMFFLNLLSRIFNLTL